MSTKMRPEEARAALVEALRSGKYKQGQGWLRSRYYDSFCCLGVACEIYRKIEGKGEWCTQQSGGPTFDGSTGSLPTSVKEWLGFDCVSGKLKGDEIRTLIGLNDEGRSFDQIADVIEDDGIRLKEEL